MEVTRKDPFTGKENTYDLDISPRELRAWQDGLSIQYAMPRLTADEREFIKTGSNIGSFDAIFADEDEDEGTDIDKRNLNTLVKLSSTTNCRTFLCMVALTYSKHDYDGALKWLIDNNFYTVDQ